MYALSIKLETQSISDDWGGYNPAFSKEKANFQKVSAFFC
ncbi:hypothetical protein FM107_13160 [Sphingobacterium sp. JB170]|nr:hypothetical protein FM107_13160 [Sphingobacterium sp. JB170]